MIEASAPFSNFKERLYSVDGKLTDLGKEMLGDLFSMLGVFLIHIDLSRVIDLVLLYYF